MNKFTETEINTMIEVVMYFVRHGDDMPLHSEMTRNALKILAEKPDYAWFYLTQEEQEEYGGQQ